MRIRWGASASPELARATAAPIRLAPVVVGGGEQRLEAIGIESSLLEGLGRPRSRLDGLEPYAGTSGARIEYVVPLLARACGVLLHGFDDSILHGRDHAVRLTAALG